jgi:hypothetical protein
MEQDDEEMRLREIAQRAMNTGFLEYDDLPNSPLFAAWIAVELTRLAATLGESVSAERVALVAETLMGVEPLHLDYALQRARRECTTFPKPCEIFDLLRQIPAFQMPE